MVYVKVTWPKSLSRISINSMELSGHRLLFKWLKMLADTLLLAHSEVITGAFNTWLSRHYHFWRWVWTEGSCGREPYLSCHHPASSPSNRVIRLKGWAGYWDVLGECWRRSVNEIHQALHPSTCHSVFNHGNQFWCITSREFAEDLLWIPTTVLEWGLWEQEHIPETMMAVL